MTKRSQLNRRKRTLAVQFTLTLVERAARCVTGRRWY